MKKDESFSYFCRKIIDYEEKQSKCGGARGRQRQHQDRLDAARRNGPKIVSDAGAEPRFDAGRADCRHSAMRIAAGTAE